MMKLSPQERQLLRNALVSAFSERSLLEQLLYYELDKNLNQITKDSNLNDVVFKLIQTAESEGWVVDLISAARKQNPGNSKLEVIAKRLDKQKLKLNNEDVEPIERAIREPTEVEYDSIKILVMSAAVFGLFILILLHTTGDILALYILCCCLFCWFIVARF